MFLFILYSFGCKIEVERKISIFLELATQFCFSMFCISQKIHHSVRCHVSPIVISQYSSQRQTKLAHPLFTEHQRRRFTVLSSRQLLARQEREARDDEAVHVCEAEAAVAEVGVAVGIQDAGVAVDLVLLHDDEGVVGKGEVEARPTEEHLLLFGAVH